MRALRAPRRPLRGHRPKGRSHRGLPRVQTAASATQPVSPGSQTRLRRQLAEQAIAHATAAEWSEAVETNQRLLELGPDAEAENRLAKALWELGELGAAREHYQAALALDPTNRIAERNIDRLRVLLAEAGEKTVPAQKGSKAPVWIFVEETGKTGFAHLIDLADPEKLAQVNPGDSVELTPEGNAPHRDSATACASASSSRASPPAC